MTPSPADILLLVSSVPVLSLIVKATAILMVGLASAGFARRVRASVRHLFLTVTFAAALLLPLVAFTAPTLELPVASTVIPAAGAVGIPGGSPGNSSLRSDELIAPRRVPPWPSLAALAAWGIGTTIVGAPLAAVLLRLRRLRRTSVPWPKVRLDVRGLAIDLGVRRDVDVVVHEDVPSPLTFGMRRPVIVLPADAHAWNEADLRRALVHELEHVRRGDWLVQIMARATCAVWWFHPLAWMAWRRLSLESEHACDDAVVEREAGVEYAEQLVSLARRLTSMDAHPTLGMANRSDLSARVSALLDPGRRRGPAGRPLAVAVVLVATVALVAVAPLRAVVTTEVVGASAAGEISRAEEVGQSRRQRGLDRELFEAAEEGDAAGAGELIDAGANVNAAISGDGSPLIGAARAGHADVARLLLDRGANPNLGVQGDGSPLIAAAAAGRRDMVVLLLDRGAHPDLVVPGDENALVQASGKGHLEVVQLLVARGADVNARVHLVDFGGRDEIRTPLSMARRGGHQAIVAFLISRGARQ